MLKRGIGFSAALMAALVSGRAAADDRWIMTLSWSPQYCEQNKGSPEPQCAGEFYFVNFGLQALGKVGDASVGDSCPSVELSENEQDRWMWTVPNRERIRYVWSQQGACSGLSPADYYSKMDYASRRVEVPAEFVNVARRKVLKSAEMKAAFVQRNPEMSADSIELQCDGHWLTEARVCFDADMQFVQCPGKGDCPDEIWMRPLRPDRKDAGTQTY